MKEASIFAAIQEKVGWEPPVEVLVMTTCRKTIGKVSNAGSSLATAPLSKAVDVLVAHPLDLRDPSGSRARSARNGAAEGAVHFVQVG